MNAGDSAVRGRIQRLRAQLKNLRMTLEREVGPLTGTFFAGEIRSRLRVMHGLEREIPDVFRPGDDARQIDIRHLPATLAISTLETVIARQQVRRERFTHYSDTELILVLDLSLSMLTGHENDVSGQRLSNSDRIENVHSGSLSDEGPPDRLARRDKLWGLYLAAFIFLTLGEKAGFVLRAIYARDGRGEFERALRPRDFRFMVLDRMTEELVHAYGRAERDAAGTENDSLGPGLRAALAVRARSVVIVVSDFLEPVSKYRNLLLEILGRHHVVLVDVANWWERQFPPPPSVLDLKNWLRYRDHIDEDWRDAARRVEDGTEARPLRIEQINGWNKQVADWRRELNGMSKRFGAGFCEHFHEMDARKAVALAGHHLGLAGS
jgi:hypothetical protein